MVRPVGSDAAERQVVIADNGIDNLSAAAAARVQLAMDGHISDHGIELLRRPAFGDENLFKRGLRSAERGIANVIRNNRNPTGLQDGEGAGRIAGDVKQGRHAVLSP